MTRPERHACELIQISEGAPQSKRIATQVYTDV
ncbi:hypothetical protein OKW33_007154 [Paraburkholderia atlantica]